METEYQRVRRLLQEEFAAALKRRKLASAYFSEVNTDIPSGLPHPDGVQRIKNASREQQSAVHEVMKASQRLNAFQIHGIVPDDLKEKDRKRDQPKGDRD